MEYNGCGSIGPLTSLVWAKVLEKVSVQDERMLCCVSKGMGEIVKHQVRLRQKLRLLRPTSWIQKLHHMKGNKRLRPVPVDKLAGQLVELKVTDRQLPKQSELEICIGDERCLKRIKGLNPQEIEEVYMGLHKGLHVVCVQGPEELHLLADTPFRDRHGSLAVIKTRKCLIF